MYHTNGIAGIDYGWIISETGNMYSGKTSALISRIDKLRRIEQVRQQAAVREGSVFQKLTIGVFKHAIDDRYSKLQIASHNGITLAAKPVATIDELVRQVELYDHRIIAVDEIQFFDAKDEEGRYLITQALQRFVQANRIIIVAGLDKNFKGEPFGPMGDILAISDEKNFHTSTCAVCSGPATLPQRLINGEPAHEDDPVVMVGANESYEPRCRRCHVVKQGVPVSSVSKIS